MSIKIEDKQLRKMQAVRKILIANRGEIARRIIRTSASMGIATFAVYTSEEKDTLYVREADEAASLGSGSLSETFLNIPLIIKTALQHQCDAIHPGYGFLSENPEFAQACADAGITFIGPSPAVIRLMGNKNEARKYVQSLGIKLPPSVIANSYHELKKNLGHLKYPLIIKAVAGGGGKGMKIVHSEAELPHSWESAQREARSYFGNPDLYVEQYMEDARHIEVQVLGDNSGNVVHLYERECTIQRRHQKIIEEAPSATLTENLRHKLLETAVHIARSMGYTSAGTLEFLFDREMNFFFLEMNTRIQVEHPVTEAITGIDIVKEQINIAQGRSLNFVQNDITLNGHAMECRIYAEDPFSGFMPSSGEILHYLIPEKAGIRIDSAFTGATSVSSSFDPMIAKITVHAPNREECIYRLNNYLKGCVLQGIKTNLEYLQLILSDSDFRSNNIATSYCTQKAPVFKAIYESARNRIPTEKIIAAVLAKNFLTTQHHNSIWKRFGEWRFPGKRSYMIDEKTLDVGYQHLENGISFTAEGENFLIEGVQNLEHEIVFHLNNEKVIMTVSEERKDTYVIYTGSFNFNVHRTDVPDTGIFQNNRPVANYKNGNYVLSPLNGRVIKLNVKKGDKVKKGALLLIIESMKMENNILSPSEAVVSDVMVSDGDQVTGKELLIKLSMVN